MVVSNLSTKGQVPKNTINQAVSFLSVLGIGCKELALIPNMSQSE